MKSFKSKHPHYEFLRKKWTAKHKDYKDSLVDKHLRRAAIGSLGGLMLLAALIINFYAGTYATVNASNQVSDFILDHIGPYNVDMFFYQGSVLFWTCIIVFLAARPKHIPFVTKSVSLFIIIRSFFIVMTHLGAPHPTEVNIGFIVSKFTFGGDLFFSGHTGLPFLYALMFWHNKTMRYIFLTMAVVFGSLALLGHKHYSIDVFAAFFITYSIYHLAQFFFKKDYELLLADDSEHPTE